MPVTYLYLFRRFVFVFDGILLLWMKDCAQDTCIDPHLHRLFTFIETIWSCVSFLLLGPLPFLLCTEEFGKRQRCLEAVPRTEISQPSRWHMKRNITILINRDGRRRVNPKCQDALATRQDQQTKDDAPPQRKPPTQLT